MICIVQSYRALKITGHGKHIRDRVDFRLFEKEKKARQYETNMATVSVTGKTEANRCSFHGVFTNQRGS